MSFVRVINTARFRIDISHLGNGRSKTERSGIKVYYKSGALLCEEEEEEISVQHSMTVSMTS